MSTKGDTNVLDLQPVTSVARETLEAPPGIVGATQLNKVRSYLKQTGVEKEFRKLIHKLFCREELPYNPYPGLAVRLRPFMEKFYMDLQLDDKIEYLLSVPLRQSRLLDLFTVQEGGPAWGLRSLLRVVDTVMINRYHWLSDNITPGYGDLYQRPGYSNQVLVALVGAAVFHGTFYHQVHIAQFRLEFLITGKVLDEALSMFVNSVIMDVDKLRFSKYHILIGLNVPVLSTGSDTKEEWLLEFWDIQSIEDHKDELMQKISDAVIGSKYILAECVFQLDPIKPVYIQGQKQYTLNFLQLVDDQREDGLKSFADFPVASLHEGVFLNQTHAETYISMFTPQIDMVDNANIRKASARPAQGVPDIPSRKFSQGVPDIPSRKFSQGVPDIPSRKFSSVVEDDYLYIHRHVHQRLQKYNPRKIQIDGFQLSDDPGSGPFAWQITSPIKSNLQTRIVGFHPWAQLFDIVYHMILLVLMDRKTTDTPLLIELYKLCHSTAGKLHMLGERNKAVRALIRGFRNKPDGHQVRQFINEYRTDINEILSLSLHERSSDLRAVGQTMSSQVTSVLAVADEVLMSSSHLNLIVLMLRDQYNFMQTTLMRLSEDVLLWCPLLKAQIDQLHASFPDAIARPASNSRDSQAAGPRDQIPKTTFIKHGFEDEQILKHENSLFVSKLVEKETSPKSMAKEAVLLRYIIDTHLDETWAKFLEETFQGKQPPDNIYPSIITRLRASAMKMDLCFEPESAVLDRILTKTAQIVDADNFVYKLPNCDAYGPATSLALIDPQAYTHVLQCIQENLVNKTYIHRKGPYRIGICLGLAGASTLYGKMKPHLTQIDLHEHYYIRGPQGCETDMAQLFAVMIQKHIWELVSTNKVPILGVFVGNDKVRWSWEEVINKKLGFFTETKNIVLKKEPIYLKAYVLFDGWRYVPVVKEFFLHCLIDGGLGTEKFFQDDPTYFYCTVFSSLERAGFHYQNGGPLRGGNPISSSNVKATLLTMNQKLIHLQDNVDYMEAYRLLMLQSLIADDTEHLVKAWRMFHSMAEHAEYVASLAQSLAELVEFEIEYSKFLSVEVSVTDESGNETKTGASPLNLGVISAMIKGLLNKAHAVTEWRISMCALSMDEFIVYKIKDVVETDRTSGKMYPIMQEATVMVLEEVAQMLTNIKTTLSNDVHNMSDSAIKTFAEMRKTKASRPLSVESHVLSDPLMFQHKPKAEQVILDDELLYKPRKQQMNKPKLGH